MELLQNSVMDKVENVLDRCIIEVLYQTGIRKAELCGLIF